MPSTDIKDYWRRSWGIGDRERVGFSKNPLKNFNFNNWRLAADTSPVYNEETGHIYKQGNRFKEYYTKIPPKNQYTKLKPMRSLVEIQAVIDNAPTVEIDGKFFEQSSKDLQGRSEYSSKELITRKEHDKYKDKLKYKSTGKKRIENKNKGNIIREEKIKKAKATAGADAVLLNKELEGKYVTDQNELLRNELKNNPKKTITKIRNNPLLIEQLTTRFNPKTGVFEITEITDEKIKTLIKKGLYSTEHTSTVKNIAKNVEYPINRSLITGRANTKIMRNMNTWFNNAENWKNFDDSKVQEAKKFLDKHSLRIKVSGMDGYFGSKELTKMSAKEILEAQYKKIGYDVKLLKQYAESKGFKLNSFAGVVDLSEAGIKLPPAVKNSLNKVMKYGGKFLRGFGKGAIVLDPMFAAFDAAEAFGKGASGKDTAEYVGKRFVEGVLNIPGLVIGGTQWAKGKVLGEDTKFETPYEFTFARDKLKKQLDETPENVKLRRIAEIEFDQTMPYMVDVMDMPDSREDFEIKKDKFLKEELGENYKITHPKQVEEEKQPTDNLTGVDKYMLSKLDV